MMAACFRFSLGQSEGDDRQEMTHPLLTDRQTDRNHSARCFRTQTLVSNMVAAEKQRTLNDEPPPEI